MSVVPRPLFVAPPIGRLQKIYAFLEGYGVILCTDPALAAWTLMANSGLPTATNPALSLSAAQISVPSTQCKQPFQPIAQVASGGGTLGPARLFPDGARVQGASQMALSYQSPSRLWIVAGTGTGATPTVLWESNDDGVSWSQITTPLPDGTLTYNQVLGVCATGADGLYITVAYGPNRDKVAVCYAARSGGGYPSWVTTTVLDLTSFTVAQVHTHTDQTGYITGAVLACDASDPDKCVAAVGFMCAAGGSPSVEAWGAAVWTITDTGRAGSPTWTTPAWLYGDSHVVAGVLQDEQSEEIMGVDASAGTWQITVHNSPSMQVHTLSSDHWDGTSVTGDDWPHGLGYRGACVVNTVRADRWSGQWGWLSPVTYAFSTLSDDGQSPPHLATNLDPLLETSLAVFVRSTAASIATAIHSVFHRGVQTFLDTLTQGVSASLTSHDNRGYWPALAGLVCSDYCAPCTLVALGYGPNAADSAAALTVFRIPTDQAGDDVVAATWPTIAGLPPAGAEPISVRARWNAVLSSIPTPTAPGTPTISAPAAGAVMADTAFITASATGTVTEYQTQISDDIGFGAGHIFSDVLTASGSSRTYGLLAFGTTYYVRVRAWNRGSASAWSSINDFTIAGHISTVVGDGTNVVTPLEHANATVKRHGLSFPIGANCVALAHAHFGGFLTMDGDVLLFTIDHAVMGWAPATDKVWLVAGQDTNTGSSLTASSNTAITVTNQFSQPAGLFANNSGGVWTDIFDVTDAGAHGWLFEAFNSGTSTWIQTLWNSSGVGTSGNGGDGGAVASAQFNGPRGGCVMNGSFPWGTSTSISGRFIVDTGNHRIRRLSSGTVLIRNFCGDPAGTAGNTGDGGFAFNAFLSSPTAMVWDATNHCFYVSDTGNNRIRKLDGTVSNFTVSNFAGDPSAGAGYSGDGGAATSAFLSGPTGLALDGGFLYIADTGNHAVRRVDLSSGVITTVCGSGSAGFSGDGGLAAAAVLNAPQGVDIFNSILYIADTGNKRIRAVTNL